MSWLKSMASGWVAAEVATVHELVDSAAPRSVECSSGKGEGIVFDAWATELNSDVVPKEQ